MADTDIRSILKTTARSVRSSIIQQFIEMVLPEIIYTNNISDISANKDEIIHVGKMIVSIKKKNILFKNYIGFRVT